MPFCAKIIVKESRKFELARPKKNILAFWRLSGSVLSRCFLAPLGVIFAMKTPEFDKFVLAYSVSALSLHVESTDSMI